LDFDVAEERALICESYFHLIFPSLYNPRERSADLFFLQRSSCLPDASGNAHSHNEISCRSTSRQRDDTFVHRFGLRCASKMWAWHKLRMCLFVKRRLRFFMMTSLFGETKAPPARRSQAGASFGFGRNLEGSSRPECGAIGIGGAPHFCFVLHQQVENQGPAIAVKKLRGASARDKNGY
jgi:hypothetical protein